MAIEKWSDDETSSFLAYWQDHMEEYSKQKISFYQAAARSLGTKEWKSVKNRCEHLDRKYAKIKQKMSASGFGIRETDPPTLRATIMKEFKWYYEMDDLLGKSTHVSPLVVVDSCKINSSTTDDVLDIDGSTLATDDTLVDANTGIGAETTEATATPQQITGKRKKPDTSKEPTISEILLDLGEKGLELERNRLELMQRQFEFEMMTRREEMQQRQREFELTYQNAQAKYELDKMMLEAKIRKIGEKE